MVLAAALLGSVFPQGASAEEPATVSEAASSNKGLGPGATVPAWAVGERIHFMPGEPAGSGLVGEPLGGSGELGRRGGTGPLLYHGSGSGVQHSPVVYPIFWGKNWEVEPGLALKKQLIKMYEGLSTSTWQGILTQYFDSTGRISSTATVATPWIDTSVTAPALVNEAKLREEVATALNAEANKSWKREFSSQFVVMPAPGSTYVEGFDTGFCGYHSIDTSGSSFTLVPYLGEAPFRAGCVHFYDPKHENVDNVVSMAATHEYAESATDPKINSWYTPEGKYIWEVGDICASEGAAEEVTSGSLKGSWVQGLWDDHQSACTLADEKPPHVYTVTEAASEITGPTAKLNGTVNAEALETKYHFEYGTTTAYGSSTTEASAGSGVTNQAENAALTGLTEGTAYHYRLVATNSTGTTDGEDHTFTALEAPENIQPPVASPVTPDQAAPESTTNGTWTHNPTSYKYQWEHCNGSKCERIFGATSSKYTPVAENVGETLVVKVTARNGGGEGTAPSQATNPVKPIGEITETALPEKSSPWGIAQGPDGNLWFADYQSSKVGKITTSGTVTEYALPAESKPWDITAGPDGNLWFTERFRDKIGKITTSGTITEYEAPGTPNIDCKPSGITTGPDGNLWFTCSNSGYIDKITTAGTVTKYGSQIGGAPTTITTGPDGNLWYTKEASGGKISKITTGGVITEYTVGGSPQGIVAGPDGNLWFTNYGKSSIEKITTGGTTTEYALPKNSGPSEIASGPDGNLWFTDWLTGKIGRITTSGTITEYTPKEGGNFGGITIGPDDNMWFANEGKNRIGYITP
jgi:streptogramin lyase